MTIFTEYIRWLFLNKVLNTPLELFRDIFISRSSHPEVSYKKGAFKNFAKFTGKHLFRSFYFNKVEGLRPETLLNNRLRQSCFPVNFAKFLKAVFH